MPRVLVPLADGVEEMEAVILVDVLRRARWEVVTAGLQAGTIRASRGVRIEPDTTWAAIEPLSFDMLVLPGGAEGTQRLMADERVLAAVREFVGAGRRVGAVCAAPLVLQAAGVLDGRRATCHPAMAERLTKARLASESVVVDEPIVTSRGAGTCFEFALTLVRLVDGADKARAIADGMVYAGAPA